MCRELWVALARLLGVRWSFLYSVSEEYRSAGGKDRAWRHGRVSADSLWLVFRIPHQVTAGSVFSGALGFSYSVVTGGLGSRMAFLPCPRSHTFNQRSQFSGHWPSLCHDVWTLEKDRCLIYSGFLLHRFCELGSARGSSPRGMGEPAYGAKSPPRGRKSQEVERETHASFDGITRGAGPGGT